MKENHVYRMAISYLEDNNLDMQEEFTDDQIATCVRNIVSRLNREGGVRQQTVRADLGNLQVKVKNCSSGSFISVSTATCTGVSKNLVEIFRTDKVANSDEVGVCLDMLNEAWYAAVNG